MKKMSQICIFFLILLSNLHFSCQKKIQPNNNQEMSKTSKNFDKIVFGSGGGFTGKYTYKLLESQSIVNCQADGKPIEGSQAHAISDEKLTKIDQLVGLVLQENKAINQKGNMNYIIEIYQKDQLKLKLQWAQPGDKPTENQQNLYNLLNE